MYFTHVYSLGNPNLLPSMSKIVEYVTFDQLMSFVTENHFFCIEHFGFRSGHSTEMTDLRLVDHLTNEMSNFNVSIKIYIDIAKP